VPEHAGNIATVILDDGIGGWSAVDGVELPTKDRAVEAACGRRIVSDQVEPDELAGMILSCDADRRIVCR